MSKHAKYGGSTAGRTIACPAWQGLSKGLPKLTAGYPARLGTSLHAVMETCLLDAEYNPFDSANTVVEGEEITQDHIVNKIYPALDACEELMDEYDVDRYYVEKWVEKSEDEAGTADLIAVSRDNKTVIFADYKSGDGVMVDAELNKQGLFYAMCGLTTPVFADLLANAEKLIIAIIQPSERREHTLDIWETDLATLKQFGREHDEAVILAESGDAEPVMGDHCAWCPAEATCPAKLAAVRATEHLDPMTLLPAQISDAMAIADKVESWAKSVRKSAHELLEKGFEVDGYKLVNKRASRVWNDVEAIEKKVRLARKLKVSDAYDSKLKSPAQLEKVVGSLGLDWDDYKEHISSVSSGTTLASVHDKREAVVFSSTHKMLAERFAQ